MIDWSDVHASAERLQRLTARMKASRLKLPSPGVLIRVRYPSVLAIVNPNRTFSTVTSHARGELMLLVYINLQPPPYPERNLTDPVELVFMSKGGTLVTTGTRSATDVMAPYEVL